MHVFGSGSEAGVPGENPQTQGEHANHTLSPVSRWALYFYYAIKVIKILILTTLYWGKKQSFCLHANSAIEK